MKIINQIGLLLAICLAGEAVALLLPFSFPSSVISMLLLLALLLSGVLKPHHLQNKVDFLLKNMAFFFLPAGVGIMESYQLIGGSLLPFLLVCALSTVITFAAASGAVRAVIALQRRRGRERV